MLASWSVGVTASAATFEAHEVKVMGKVYPAVMIRGKIDPGDPETFKRILVENPAEVRNRIYLSLDSQGGDLRASVALGHLIREVGFYTIVEEDSVCFSSCFVLYSAGFFRMGQLPLLRFDNEETSIGVHRASIERSAMAALGPGEARATSNRGEGQLAAALREFDVPESIIEMALLVPAAGLRRLTVGELNTFKVPSWLVDLAHAQCNLQIPQKNTGNAIAVQYFLRLGECEAMVLGAHRIKQFDRK